MQVDTCNLTRRSAIAKRHDNLGDRLLVIIRFPIAVAGNDNLSRWNRDRKGWGCGKEIPGWDPLTVRMRACHCVTLAIALQTHRKPSSNATQSPRKRAENFA